MENVHSLYMTKWRICTLCTWYIVMSKQLKFQFHLKIQSFFWVLLDYRPFTYSYPQVMDHLDSSLGNRTSSASISNTILWIGLSSVDSIWSSFFVKTGNETLRIIPSRFFYLRKWTMVSVSKSLQQDYVSNFKILIQILPLLQFLYYVQYLFPRPRPELIC